MQPLNPKPNLKDLSDKFKRIMSLLDAYCFNGVRLNFLRNLLRLTGYKFLESFPSPLSKSHGVCFDCGFGSSSSPLVRLILLLKASEKFFLGDTCYFKEQLLS